MKKIVIILILILLTGCRGKDKIKIGYIANLSGRQSDLGIKGRDGLLYAIENQDTRRLEVELHVRDNQGNLELCRTRTRELVELDVDIIIGPLTSSMAQGVIDGASGSNTIILSPTASTDKLTDIDDNFLRLTSPSSAQGVTLGEIIKTRNENRVVVVGDYKNREYVDGVYKGLKKTLSDIEELELKSFTSRDELILLIDELKTAEMDSLLFITTGIDAALVIQNLSKEGVEPSLYGSGWVKATQIEQHGGRAIENMVLTDSIKNHYETREQVEFKESYYKRFNSIPNLPSLYTFEATSLFLKLKQEDPSLKGNELKSAIINQSTIEGVFDNYKMNEFGDVDRKIYSYIIKDGKYEDFNR